MTQKELERKVNAFSKRIRPGDTINMKYDGHTIASYEFIEWSIDAKTPRGWLLGCLCFDINLKGRDINKVSLEFAKA